jgi:hypothetical protein
MKKTSFFLFLIFANFFAKAQFPLPYCAEAYASNVEPITLVNFAGINNSTSAATGGTAHENFTAITGNVTAGLSYTITLKGNSDGNYSNLYRLFVDWNNDNDFLDAGESFNCGTITNSTGLDALTTTASITIPALQPTGNRRMRVGKKFGSYQTPCNTTGYGQAEDYTLSITASTLCSGTPTAPTASAPTNACSGVAFNLVATGGSAGSNITYQWQSSAVGANSFTNISGATTSTFSNSQTVAKDYRIVITCPTTPASSNSNVITVNMATTGCPATDNACGANALAVNAAGSDCGASTTGTIDFALITPSTAPVACSGASTTDGTTRDFWHRVTVPASGTLQIVSNNPNTAFWDMAIYTITDVCGTPTYTEIASECVAQVQPVILLTARTPGEVLYLRMWRDQASALTTGTRDYTLCANTPPTASPNCLVATDYIAPINAATNVTYQPNVTFTWNNVAGATSYDIYLEAGTSPTIPTTLFTSNFAAQAGATTTGTWTTALGSTSYVWYVVPKNAAGAATGCGVSNSFTTAGAAVLDCNLATTITACGTPQTATIAAGTGIYTFGGTSPNNSCGFSTPGIEKLYSFTPTTTGIYTLNITAATGGYIDYLFKDASTGCAPTGWTCLKDYNAAGSITMGTLTAGTTYFLILDPEGTGGMTQTFNIGCPPIPITSCATNVTPANAATGVTPAPNVNFSWSAVANATSYSLFISATNNPPIRATDSVTTVTTTNVNIAGLVGNTTYYWYVIPKNAGGEGPNCITAAQTTSFTTSNPPANDECAGAVPLTVGNGFCTTPVTGTLILASASAGAPPKDCAGSSLLVDVWYKVVVPASQSVIVQTSAVSPNGNNDMVLQAVSTTDGSCAGITIQKACDDDSNPDSGPSANHSKLTITNAGPADSTYYLRVFPFSAASYQDFAICAWNPTPAIAPIVATGANCVNGTSNIDSAQKYMWVPLRDGSGNIIAEVYPNGNKLGLTSYSYYINPGAVRTDVKGIKYLDRNITITPTTQPTTNVDVRLYYKSTELDALQLVDPLVTSSNINVTKTPSTCAASSNPIDFGTILLQSSNRDFGLDSIVTVSVPSFSTFYLHGGTIALPVTLSTLRGELTGATNTIYWTTATESNNRKFVVERSINGTSFTTLGDVATRAINGNSNAALSYSFVDANPVQGKAFYRIQMVDNSNGVKFSQVVSLRRGTGKLEIVDVRPNPTSGTLYFNVLGANSNINVAIRDLSGKTLLNKTLVQSSNFNVDMSTLSTGMYILEATDVRNGEKAMFKVIKN